MCVSMALAITNCRSSKNEFDIEEKSDIPISQNDVS